MAADSTLRDVRPAAAGPAPRWGRRAVSTDYFRMFETQGFYPDAPKHY